MSTYNPSHNWHNPLATNGSQTWTMAVPIINHQLRSGGLDARHPPQNSTSTELVMRSKKWQHSTCVKAVDAFVLYVVWPIGIKHYSANVGYDIMNSFLGWRIVSHWLGTVFLLGSAYLGNAFSNSIVLWNSSNNTSRDRRNFRKQSTEPPCGICHSQQGSSQFQSEDMVDEANGRNGASKESSSPKPPESTKTSASPKPKRRKVNHGKQKCKAQCVLPANRTI